VSDWGEDPRESLTPIEETGLASEVVVCRRTPQYLEARI